ncbi:GDSL-type esterase/lipase family protein [Chitinophaga sp. CC14]|uniref:GDSL-type esterase/lipase family protein n=1 Tax=Chitinophaga sp. CC14 TaxID=3029199 RepID=UPI003B80BF85
MKKMMYFLTCLLTSASAAMAQESLDSSYANNYYKERVKFFNQLPVPARGVVFLGNSITEVGPWSEVLPGMTVSNRGISGDNSFGVYARLDQVLALHPRKIFLLIGVNDIKRGTPLNYIVANYERIAAKVKAMAPHTTLYLQSVLPVTEPVLADIYVKIRNEKIKLLNEGLQQIAAKYHCTYIDLHNDVFAGEDGQLKRELTTDGLHLQPQAYILWVEYLKRKKYL